MSGIVKVYFAAYGSRQYTNVDEGGFHRNHKENTSFDSSLH